MQSSKIKNIVITGPTGAIGIALIKLFIKKRVKVLALVRKGSNRINRIPKSKLVLVKEINLSEYKDFYTKVRYDVFFHFAWEGTIGSSRDDVFLQNLNVQHTLDSIRLAKKLGCHTFLGAGSQAEYGRSKQKLTSKTPTFPENGYGIAKLCAGQLSRILAKQLFIRHIWVRILSVYGPFDSEKTLIMSSINKILNGTRPLFTKGEQYWDYLYSDDAALAMDLIARKGVNGKIYNLGSGIHKKLKYFIKEIWKQTQSNIPLKFGEIPYSHNQLMYLCSDPKDLIDIGFNPKTTFKDGISRTINWVKSNYK
jgi:nucleoside-diphosphate-sugar epimerase